MSVRVDGYGTRAHTLESDRLPQEHHFVVGARTHDDQVARGGGVDGGLNRIVGRILTIDVARGFAADGDGDGVNRPLAVARGDYQFAAFRRGRYAHLLDRAGRRGSQLWYGDLDLCIAP